MEAFQQQYNIFSTVGVSCTSDIWLLENQLSFFIIEEIYNLAFSSRSNYPCFTQLTCEFFEKLVRHRFSLQNEHHMPIYPNFKIMHSVNLLRTFFFASITKAIKKKACQRCYASFVHCESVARDRSEV
jgi:hypothetical protein